MRNQDSKEKKEPLKLTETQKGKTTERNQDSKGKRTTERKQDSKEKNLERHEEDPWRESM